MSLEVKTCMPTTLEAGDAFQLAYSNSSYTSALGYTTKLMLLSLGAPVEIAGVQDGDGWTFDFDSTVTVGLPIGEYRWKIFAYDNTANRVTVESGMLYLDENTEVAHVLTPAETMLASCEAAITFLTNNKTQSTAFNGQSVSYADLSGLYTKRVTLKAEVIGEARARQRRKGLGTTTAGISFRPL